jgi:hypothetical protein
MDFLKKHYEKVLLGLMLAGLIGVLVFMLFYIASDTEDMTTKRISYTNPRVTALTNLNTTLLDAAMMLSKSPYYLDLETTNKLFNPMEWQKSLEGKLILAAKRTGSQVAEVTNIAPLYLIVSLDSVMTNELGVRYVIQVERQAAATASARHSTRHYVSKEDKPNPKDPFALESVKGPPENPDALVLKLTDSGELVTLSPGKPFHRVDGYMADFRYDPERKAFHNRRVGDKVGFGGVDYTIVEVNKNELILQDQSNQKKTSLPFAP